MGFHSCALKDRIAHSCVDGGRLASSQLVDMLHGLFIALRNFSVNVQCSLLMLAMNLERIERKMLPLRNESGSFQISGLIYTIISGRPAYYSVSGQEAQRQHLGSQKP